MIDFILLYKEFFLSEKIRRKSRILNIFFENGSIKFNPNYVTVNEKYMSDLEVSFESIIYDDEIKSFEFLDSFDYDIIIFVNLFSYNYITVCEEIVNNIRYKSKKSKFMFINEIMTSETHSLNPISYARDLLFNISSYNIGRTILLREVYDMLLTNNFRILDATRLDTDTCIPTYPIEYFLITSCTRFL